jgi:hypothetical protein
MRLDQGRPSAGTRGGDPNHRGSPDREFNRCIGVLHFASLEDKNSVASEVSKSREVIRVVHQRRTRGSNWSHRGKSQQEVVYRHFDHRDIGDSIGNPVGQCIAAFKSLKPRREVRLRSRG